MENTKWINWDETNISENQDQQENIPTWGEQPSTEQQPGWGDQTTLEEEPQNGWGDEPTFSSQESNLSFSTTPPIQPESLMKDYSYLGGVDLLKIKNELYYFDFNVVQILEELNSSKLNPIGNDGLFQTQFNPETKLGSVITSLTHLAQSKGLELTSVLVKKLHPSESSLNTIKGNPKHNFILFLQGDYNSGEVILDLSSIGGPTQKITDTTPGHLTLIPGWLPYRITKNNSDKELIALVGTIE